MKRPIILTAYVLLCGGLLFGQTVTLKFDSPGTQLIPADDTTYAVIDEYGQDQPNGAITLGSGGNYPFHVPLIASRREDDHDGRTYTITVNGQDTLGNVGSRSAVVTVPQNQPTYVLSVFTIGNGSGMVTSSDGQINCGTICSGNYSSGSSVTLTATAAQGSLNGLIDAFTTDKTNLILDIFSYFAP